MADTTDHLLRSRTRVPRLPVSSRPSRATAPPVPRATENPGMRTREVIALMLAVGLFTGVAQGAAAPTPDAAPSDRTPPRLSFVDGQVSFWRPGAQDWAQAQVNTPLAPGDELATASPGNLEVQIGARAFVRAWANTQVGLANQEPDFLH